MREEHTRSGGLGVGLDVGDRYTRVCVMAAGAEQAEVVEERRVETTVRGLDRALAPWARARVALETGMHAPWIDEHLRSGGYEVLVADARKLALVYGATVKDDRRDARLLAELALSPPRWLTLVRHRDRATREQQLLLKVHERLVRERTRLVNAVRGLLKPFGVRVPSCSTRVFPERAREAIPERMRVSLEPLLQVLEELAPRVGRLEKQMLEAIDAKYPDARRMMQVPGVGPITALCLRLTVEDPGRFRRPREIGPYLGLTPRRDQSGDCERQLGISKAGNMMARRLLVSSAAYVLGPFGPDCDLKRWGLRRMERGGPIARRKARVAVARRLAVLLLRLWQTGQPYEPFRSAPATASA